MIVLWGIDGDGPMDAVREALTSAGSEFHFVNQRELAENSVEVDVDSHAQAVGRIRSRRRWLSMADVRSVYARPYNTAQVLGPAAQSVAQAALATDLTMSAFCELCQGMVVNRPSMMASNNSKPYQMEVIRKHGFGVPATLITTDAVAAREFLERHRRVIYKSISGVRSIVRSLGVDDGARLGDVANCPTQFQEQVAGTDVRVHVVGNECFATAIDSGADDYRYATRQQHHTSLAATTLPDLVAERCIRLTQSLGLVVAGVDLRHTPDDRWVCFEANPSPAFTYYEEGTGQPLAAAVAALLAA
ncbi:MAG: hypothetical protein QOC57_252 [Ilumatobacteraceae bacterium]|jgi:glutathione synthase/RimK-type ligase-like ATP-grasp enzyme|nr:hypothetical protein [Ilumatobacteraceae bacterium]